MINIQNDIKTHKLSSKLILQVHDELVFDLHTKEKEKMLSIVRKNMQAAVKLSVPLSVEIGIAENWLDAH